ncbi:MAG: CDP-alcohol phosphatidyltransferase family protein [Chloroflexi bacterium]|nr:CDP-alcohol phosphatidyltransferase family protein [Chloroflexota bacterium]
MAWLKVFANGLTGMRLVLSGALFILGPVAGIKGLDTAAWLLLVAWTTDVLDGPLARLSGKAGQDWLGRNDLYIDMLLATGLLFYMAISKMAHPLTCLIYLLVWLAIRVCYGRFTKPLGALYQGVVYIWFAIGLLARRPLIGRIMVLWVVGNITATWGRLINREVPRFFKGLLDFFTNRTSSRSEKEKQR